MLLPRVLNGGHKKMDVSLFTQKSDGAKSWPCCRSSWFDGKGHKWWECTGRSRRVTTAIVLFFDEIVVNVVEKEVSKVLLGEHWIDCWRHHWPSIVPPEVLSISTCSRQVGTSGRSQNPSFPSLLCPSLVRHHHLTPNIPFMTVILMIL